MYPLAAALLLVAPLATTLEESSDVYSTTPPYIPQERVDSWAEKIVGQLEAYERRAFDMERLKKSLHLPTKHRDGAALVNEFADRIATLAASRAAAAVTIARAAEKSAVTPKKASNEPLPEFYPSRELDRYKSKFVEDECGTWHDNNSCLIYPPLRLDTSSQFAAKVTRKVSSVHVPVGTFDCAEAVLSEINRTNQLDRKFKENYGNDATFSWQYFCSARGFLRHYPGASWESMAGAARNKEPDCETDLYDCRMRAWYIEATGAPRDILVLLDSTGSMTNITQLTAYELIRELFTALTDDDYVNVIRFERYSFSSVYCFDDELVPANYINVAALISNITSFLPLNYTRIPDVLEDAVKRLNKSRLRTEAPASCQQAIVLLTDSVPENYTEKMRKYDPEGRIRFFAFLLGIGNLQKDYIENLACDIDGYFAQLESPNDASEQARRILTVLERPAVLHHQAHPSSAPRYTPVWGDLYAHVQDTRFALARWHLKDNVEQRLRYMRLRRDKIGFLSPEQQLYDYEKFRYKTSLGHYSEEEDPNKRYQLMISVSVPVYDPVLYENVTVKLMEETQRNSTRLERVARLLGVAGVDLPLDDLRLRLPYHKLGPGGSFFLMDHRGNVILHDDLRPVVDGDILKNGYRTVDVLDVELPDSDLPPRQYTAELTQFREAIMKKEIGSMVLSMLLPYDGRRRAVAGMRHYFWRPVEGTSYMAVVSLPARSGDTHAASSVPHELSRALAADAHRALNDTDFFIQPNWLYCRYIEQRFDRREDELLHFLRRISEEDGFQFQQLYYSIDNLPPGLLDLPYICDPSLMSRLAWEAHATSWFASSEEEERVAADTKAAECALGTSAIFIATVGGLTRWRNRVVLGDGPSASLPPDAGISLATTEAWYRRAAAAGTGTMVLHAAVAARAAPGWLTAARALRHYGVTGFHFRASHLAALLNGVTAPICEGTTAADDECELTCASESWLCVLVDDAGWVLAGIPAHGSGHARHLSTARPAIMKQLLDAKMFHKRWLYDYQAICFTHVESGVPGSAPRLWPLGVFAWNWLADTMRCVLFEVHRALQTLLLLVFVDGGAATKVEEQKRKVRVRKDFDREQWEKLYDRKVLINRTRLTTCDRQRVIYSLRSDASARLASQSVSCGNWSMVAVHVPRTNMLLLAIYTLCGDAEPHPPLQDPTHNTEIPLSEPSHQPVLKQKPGEHRRQCIPTMEDKLACWRHNNSAKLIARGAAATCYPHSWEQEKEFRQCEPRVADEEPGTAAQTQAEAARARPTCLTFACYAFLAALSFQQLFLGSNL